MIDVEIEKYSGKKENFMDYHTRQYQIVWSYIFMCTCFMFLLSYTFSEYCSNQQSTQQLEWSITANCQGVNGWPQDLTHKSHEISGFGCYLKSEPLPEPGWLLGESWDHHSASIWGFSTTLKGISAVLKRCPPTTKTLSKLCPLVPIR